MIKRAICLAIPLVFACDSIKTHGHEENGKVAADTVAVADWATSFLAATADPAFGKSTPEEAATAVKNAAATLFTPASCLDSELNSAKTMALLTFTNCSGPYGLAELDGQFTAEFKAVSPTSLTISLGGNLVLKTSKDGGTDVRIDAVVTSTNTGKSAAVTSKAQGRGPLGNDLQQDGTWTATWSGSCIAIDGSFKTIVGGSEYATSVGNYQRCGTSCPAKDGMVAVEVNGTTTTLTYGGGTSADVTSLSGESGTLTLVCGG
ncbi:MAG: hypothetical protein QM765_06620 [Myxococcales bacterium]